MEGTVGDQNLVVIPGRNGDANVIACASDQGTLIVDCLPVLSAIVGAPEGTLVLCLDQGEDAAGICSCDCDVDFAKRRVWQSMFLKAGPLRSTIVRNIYGTPRPATEFAVRVHLRLPHSGEQRVWVVRIQSQTRAAYIVTCGENPFPMLTAIHRSEDAPLRLRSGHAAQHAGENDVRVGWMNHDSS